MTFRIYPDLAIAAGPVAALGQIRSVLLAGDSNCRGSNGLDTGYVGGWRTGAYHYLRSWRSDFDFVGSAISVPEQLGSLALWRCAGAAGWKIEDMTAAVPAEIAVTGAPGFILDNFGTNNIAGGDSLATMQTKRLALDAAWAAAAPNSRVVRLSLIPFVPGSTTGANQAAWDAQRVAYNAWMAATYGTSGYLDATSQLSQSEIQPDGVHLNRSGEASMGYAIANTLDARLGPRFGFPLPRFFRQRKPLYSISCPAAADGLTLATPNRFAPGADSYAFAVDYYPTTLDAAALHTVAALGPYGALGSGFFLLGQQGQALRLYWDNPAGTIFGQPDEIALVLNKWHRCVFIADATTLSVGLYVNAQLVGLVQGVAPWAFAAARTAYLNQGPNFSGARGYYDRVRCYRGAGVPKPGSMAAQLAVEADYYLDEPIGTQAVGGYYDLNGILSGLNGDPSWVAVAGAAFAAPYPTGTPIRPWELGAAYP